MSRDAEQIDHRGHTNVTSTSTEKPAEDPPNEGDEKDCPERNGFNPRVRKANLGSKFDSLDRLGKALDCRDVVVPGFCRVIRLIPASIHSQRRPSLPGAEKSNSSKDGDRNRSDDYLNVASLFQNFNRLYAGLGTGDCPDHHDAGQLQVDIAKDPMGSGGDNRLPDNVGKVSPDHIVHW